MPSPLSGGAGGGLDNIRDTADGGGAILDDDEIVVVVLFASFSAQKFLKFLDEIFWKIRRDQLLGR